MNIQHFNSQPGRVPEEVQKPTFLSGLDAAQIIAALKAHHRVAVAIGISVFAIVMAFTLFARMDFLVTGRLYLGELDGKIQISSANDFSNTGLGDVYSEIEIMRSRSRIEEAVLASGLNVTIEPVGWSAPRYWRWLLSRRDPRILDVSFSQLRAANTTLAPGARDPRKLSVEFVDGDHFALREGGRSRGKLLSLGSLGNSVNVEGFTLTLIPGTTGKPKAGAKYDLEIEPTDKTVEAVLRKLDIVLPKSPTASEPVKVLSLELSGPAPRPAAAFLRSLMEIYLHERQTWKTEDATAAEQLVTRQLEGMQKSLNDTEQKLANVKVENQIIVQQSQAQAMIAQLAAYEQQRTAARLEATMFENMRSRLGKQNPTAETFMLGESNDTVLHELGASLAESRQVLADLDSRYSDAAPDVKQQQAKVNAQFGMIRSYVGNRVTRARDQVRELDQVIAQYEKKLQRVPNAELALAQLGRESEVYSRMYSYLLESQQRTTIAKAATGSKNRILDWPQVPLRESGPNLALRMASGLLGLLLGGILVVARSMSSGAFRSEAEVRSILHATTVFANVPGKPKPRGLSSSVSTPPVFDLMALPFENLGFAEAFRTLRTNLYFALPEPHGKVILITSPSPGDGKTTTSFCLASILAADNKRVLLIDTDLRKPSHYLMTRHWPEPGLRGVLKGTASEKSVIHTVHLSRGSFDSLDSGFDVPAELLSSPGFTSLLIRTRHQYDYILLDAPSYPLVADPLILASQSDFVLSVVRLGNTPRSAAEEHARGLISRARGHAVIVNTSDAAQTYGYPSFSYAQPMTHETVLEAETHEGPYERTDKA